MKQGVREYYYTAQMLEDVPVGIALLDAQDFHIIVANACFREFFSNAIAQSQQPEELESVSTLSSPGLALARNLFRYANETGKPYQENEVPVLHSQRGITYWNSSIKPIYDQRGRISQFLVTASDVTTQVIARLQIEEKQKKLQTEHIQVDTQLQRLEVIETIARSVRKEMDSENIARVAIRALVDAFDPICICIHIAEPNNQELRQVHTYVDESEQTVQILQQMAPELQNIPYDSSLWPARARNYHEPILINDLKQASGTMYECDTASGQDPPTNGYICLPLWFKDHFEGTLTILFREAISANSLVVRTVIDCSTYISAALAHSRLLAEVEYERGRLRAVLDYLPEGIFLVRAKDSRISYANKAATHILNVPQKYFLKISLRETFTKQRHRLSLIQGGLEISNQQIPILRALDGETVVGEEIQFVKPDGHTITLLVAAAPIWNEAGVITGAASIFQDITERKSVEQQKNEFLSIASHELRTPTTTIQGFAEILQMLVTSGHDLGSQHTLQAIDSIVEQCARLTKLVDEMLDLSRIEHARLVLNKGSHNLIATLKRAVESMAITDRQRPILLVLEDQEETGTLMGEFDENRIFQVVSNFISNALKYSQPNSEIEVGLRCQEERPGRALLWVRDSGIGIPARDLPHIFERFHRASNIDRSISGLGIGLYLAREIVTQHGGSIWAESQEGAGSTFSVELPLYHDAP